MATRLIQIVTFANVPPTGIATLPHGININDVPQAPDFIAGDTPNFSINATPTDVSVVNNSATDTLTINVWLELKHTMPRQLGAAQLAGLVPRPFVASAGTSGGGTLYPDITDDPLYQGVSSPNPGRVTIGPASIPSGTLLFTGGLVVASEIILGNIMLAQPDPFVGTINDLELPGAVVWVFDTGGGGGTLTGIQVDGPNASHVNYAANGSLGGIGLKILINDGIGNLTVAHNTGSQPQNRFQLANSTNKIIPPEGVGLALFAQGGWRLLGGV